MKFNHSHLALLVGWLRDPSRNPLFLHAVTDDQIDGHVGEVVTRFLSWTRPKGFELELITRSEHPHRWVGHWVYRGSTLEGFKQPSDAESEDEARLLACAALLENAWCRARL